jgi:hypothetical protein
MPQGIYKDQIFSMAIVMPRTLQNYLYALVDIVRQSSQKVTGHHRTIVPFPAH